MHVDATSAEVRRAAASGHAGFLAAVDQVFARFRDELLPLLEQVKRDPTAARLAMGDDGFETLAHAMACRILADAELARIADMRAELDGLADVA